MLTPSTTLLPAETCATSTLTGNQIYQVGADDMAAGLCGTPRITLHPIPCLDPYLVLLPLVLLTADTGWAPIFTGLTEGLTLLTISLATNTTQVVSLTAV